MEFNNLAGRVHLPTLASYYGLNQPATFHKLPGFGWYGKWLNTGLIFNFMDLYIAHHPKGMHVPHLEIMKSAYRFFTQEHDELLESRTAYSEVSENRIGCDYLHHQTTAAFYRSCRDEALNGVFRFNDRPVKFTKLLEDLNMPELIKAGIGIVNQRVVNNPKLVDMPITKAWYNRLVVPTFFTPDNRVASLEIAEVKDITQRTAIYKNAEIGWYGRLDGNIVGNVRDLLTTTGATWDHKLAYWCTDRPQTLHKSIQPKQCLDMWINSGGLAFNKSPLELLKENGAIDSVKDYLKNLTLTQIKELEKFTNKELYPYWLAQRYDETTISGIKFACKNGGYYYQRRKDWLEFSNFTVNLAKIKKEDGVFYQYGDLLVKENEMPFKLRQSVFNSQYSLIQALNEVSMEGGSGVLTVSPNMKHYITNVINAFNLENLVERPAPPKTETIQAVTLGEL